MKKFIATAHTPIQLFDLFTRPGGSNSSSHGNILDIVLTNHNLLMYVNDLNTKASADLHVNFIFD